MINRDKKTNDDPVYGSENWSTEYRRFELFDSRYNAYRWDREQLALCMRYNLTDYDQKYFPIINIFTTDTLNNIYKFAFELIFIKMPDGSLTADPDLAYQGGYRYALRIDHSNISNHYKAAAHVLSSFYGLDFDNMRNKRPGFNLACLKFKKECLNSLKARHATIIEMNSDLSIEDKLTILTNNPSSQVSFEQQESDDNTEMHTITVKFTNTSGSAEILKDLLLDMIKKTNASYLEKDRYDYSNYKIAVRLPKGSISLEKIIVAALDEKLKESSVYQAFLGCMPNLPEKPISSSSITLNISNLSDRKASSKSTVVNALENKRDTMTETESQLEIQRRMNSSNSDVLMRTPENKMQLVKQVETTNPSKSILAHLQQNSVSYPAELKRKVNPNEVTGPRVAKAIKEIHQKLGREESVKVAKQFLLWAKQHNRHFNTQAIHDVILSSSIKKS